MTANNYNLQEKQPKNFYWRKNLCSYHHIGNTMVHKNEMFLLLKKPEEMSFDRDMHKTCMIKEF